jgi:hypothetical protein
MTAKQVKTQYIHHFSKKEVPSNKYKAVFLVYRFHTSNVAAKSLIGLIKDIQEHILQKLHKIIH